MSHKKEKTTREIWTEKARNTLIGFTIVDVMYSRDEDWYAQAPFILMKKPRMGQKPEEKVMMPMRDDEGNDGGALYIKNLTTKEDETLPVIWDK